MHTDSHKKPNEPRFFKSVAESDFTIDKEFQYFMPKASELETTELEKSLSENGILMPLVVWLEQNTLIDGHRRYEIAKKLDISFFVVYKSFSSREDVLIWLINHQLSRRNVNRSGVGYLRGKEHNLECVKKIELANSDLEEQELDRSTVKSIEKATKKKIAQKYAVGASTIQQDINYCKALDTIATNVSPEISNQIKDKDISFKKPEAIVVSKASIAEREVVKAAFAETNEAKKILKQIEQVLSFAPEEKKFPYPVGSIVTINARKNPDLWITNGFMGIVTEVSPDIDYAVVQTCCGEFRVRTRNVCYYRLNEPERSSAESIVYRMARLAICEPTSATVSVIQDISRRVVNCLSPQEEKWITDAEELAKLEKFETVGQLELSESRKAQIIDDNHRTWIVNLFWQNIETLKEIDFSSIANAIAKYRPEDAAKIVLEFASHENLASEIIGKLSLV